MQDNLQWIEQDQQKGRRNRKDRRTRRPDRESNLLEEDWSEEAEASEDLLRRKKGKAKPRREKMLDW